jgi:predicted RNA-binding protein YlxR (DUF448 family)
LLAATAREEIDEGLSGARKGVERLCVATREVRPVADMIRFVAAPDGKVVPDIERKLPGRGVWITATRAALDRALRERSIQRAFRGDAEVDAELPDLLERLLERSVLEGLSLANKAGQVVTGAAKVESALTAGEVALLIHASDAQPDGVRKLDAVARAVGERLPVLRAFGGEQLDLALGRPNVVHAALLAHPAGAGFLGRCLRLDRWRNGEAAVAGQRTAG